MILRDLVGHIEGPEYASDLSGDSPVFAIVRQADVPLGTPGAWSAVSIVSVELDSEDGSVELVVDESDDATDITLAELRVAIAGFPSESSEYTLFVGVSTVLEDDSEAREDDPIVAAYIDDDGLGLMAWFDGYEEWRKADS